MKKTIKLSILLLTLLSVTMGCSSVRYTETDKDGITKEFSYSRLGKQELRDFSFVGKKDGTKSVSLGSAKGDAGELAAVINRLLDLAEKAGKASAGIP